MFINSLGLAYAMTGDYGLAHVYFKQALEILVANFGANHIEVADVYFNLGDISMRYLIELDEMKTKKQVEQQAKIDETRKYYLEAQRIIQSTFDNEHTKAVQLLSLLFIVNNFSSWK
jgi:tetratricopeptide (TPR) repeat protein